MLNEGSFGTLDSLLDQVLDLPENERTPFIEALEQQSPELASDLRRLVNQLEAADSFLDEDAEKARDRILYRSLEQLQDWQAQDELAPGDELGRYRIGKVLGKGLRATVYRATREEEGWNQQVAIKLMARGVNTDDVLRRFFSERQILTELKHPGICTLLDAGVTPESLPYFVMEYIDGVSITAYCREQGLSLTDRVRLFGQVCTAVGQAHRHGVVHRDIKPDNILVTEEGQVKLLDFGIAKLVEGEAVDVSAITQLEVRPMTPAYASPEQREGGSITTATDVYQLGLLLTEMISGVERPLAALGIEADSRPAREPSRITGLELAGLPYDHKALRGDLDWIVLKCLEPDPALRYGSAEALRADIGRYLENRPVTARRSSFPYLAGKFIRRRPGLALSAAVTLVATIAFILMLAWFNLNLAQQRSAAVAAAERAEQVKDLLVRFLTSADPYRGSGADTRVSELLADSERALNEELEEQPRLQAELTGTLADVYQGLSMTKESAALRQRQLDLLTALDGTNSFAALQAERKLLLATIQSVATETTLQSLLNLRERLVDRYPDEWLERARVNYDIGNLHLVYGRAEDAVPFAEQAVGILRQHTNSPDDLASSLSLLGRVSQDYETTLRHHQEAAQILQANHGPDHPATLVAWVAVASTLNDLSRNSESLEIFDRVIPLMEQELGRLHEQTFVAVNNRAVSLWRMGETDAAIEGFREVVRRDREAGGGDTRVTAERLQNLGASLNRLGRYEEAIETLTEAARIFEMVNLPGNPSSGFPYITLADISGKQGDVEALETNARKALERLEGNLPDDHHAILKCRCLLGDALIRKGNEAEGKAMVQAVLDNLEGRQVANPRLADECRAALQAASR